MTERVFAMPDLGEGLEDAEVVAWLVAEGDPVELNQPLVEVQTAKATVEIPSPVSGRVTTLHGAAGQTVAVGAPLVTFEADDPGAREDELAAPDVRRLPVDSARRSIAEGLERQAAIPQVTTFRTVDCSALEGFRAELGVSPLPVVLAAWCRVVADHPMLNASWGGDEILLHGPVDVGIAVETEGGLAVPVLRAAESRGIAELATEIRRLADAARTGTFSTGDVGHPAIAITNAGSYGSEAGTPILSPGTGVTLALGAIAPRALVSEGTVEARPAMTLSLTFDHRLLDGAAAGRGLSDLVSLLQDVERLRDLPR
jgi:2-oxoisovalerate dehydrogenase E2 component (dihydrolipoyl transacylase)